MGRRRQLGQPSKTAMGHAQRAGVFRKLDELRDTVITATVNFGEINQAEIIDFLFDADTRRILREAYGKVAGSPSWATFPLFPAVSVRLDVWDHEGLACPRSDAINVDMTKAADFYESVLAANKIVEDYAMVKHVVAWLDEHASANAIRHYFPSVLALLPADHNVPYELSDRFIEPTGVGRLLPLIRESIPVVASALVVDGMETPAAEHPAIRMTFNGGEVNRHGYVFSRDTAFINI